MDISAQILIFATVVDQGSISAAARSVGQTPSAVGKQIGSLEDHVHCRLPNRSRTGVSPTQEGQDFYEKCEAMADKFKEAEALILNLDGTPRGKPRFACTVAFGTSQHIPALPTFMDDNPEAEISPDLTDRDVDLQAEGFDAGICFDAPGKSPDAVARRIMQSRRVLCAAPSYLRRHGTPKDVAALADHNCFGIAGNSRRNSWIVGDHCVEAQGNFKGNSTGVIFRAALAGVGIARLPCFMANRKFRSGELIHVLPTYSPPSTDIVVQFANRRNLARRIRVFVVFLVREFRESVQNSVDGSFIAEPNKKAS